MLVRLLTNEEGATAIEYGLILVMISLVGVATFQALGLSLVDIFTTTSDAMKGN